MEPIVYEKIEAYLTKRLSDSEKTVFEGEMASSTSLKETVVKVQLLRNITQRNLFRKKLLAIHEAKTNEWQGHFYDKEVEEVVTHVTPENTLKEEDIREVEAGYESRPSSGFWKTIASILGIGLLLFAIGFVFLAKNPVEIRKGNPNLTAEGIELDSLQLTYLERFNKGKAALKSNKAVEAIPYFDEVLAFQALPNYYNDASQFLKAVAYSEQGPNRASKIFNEITSKKVFNYPYTNKDKLQLWCKIQWAKLMGIQDVEN